MKNIIKITLFLLLTLSTKLVEGQIKVFPSNKLLLGQNWWSSNYPATPYSSEIFVNGFAYFNCLGLGGTNTIQGTSGLNI